MATFDEIDEDDQPLIQEIVNKILNQTADSIIIFNEPLGYMVITFENEIIEDDIISSNADADFGSRSGLDSDDIVIRLPHNFTEANGYEYRDGIIYKPDGTELFAPE